MDFMIAWYPIVKFLVGVLLVTIMYQLGKRKKYKLFGVMLLLAIVIAQLSPIKIDGTNSKEYHKANESHQQTKYKEVERESVLTIIPQPTFQQRMHAEDERSLRANELLEGEIK